MPSHDFLGQRSLVTTSYSFFQVLFYFAPGAIYVAHAPLATTTQEALWYCGFYRISQQNIKMRRVGGHTSLGLSFSCGK